MIYSHIFAYLAMKTLQDKQKILLILFSVISQGGDKFLWRLLYHHFFNSSTTDYFYTFISEKNS